MYDQEEGRAARSKTGGSAGTPGRAGYDQDENARVADTSPGDLRTGAQATAGRIGGPGMGQTAAERGTAGFEPVPGMLERTGTSMNEGRGQSGMQYLERQGGMQMRNRSDLPDTVTGAWTGAPPEAVTHGRGEQQSEEAGMRQASMMLREARESGDPELMLREEDLHARQQNLGEREQSLRERDEQLRQREENLRDRQSRYPAAGGEEYAPPGTQGQHWRGEPWAKNPKVGGEGVPGGAGQHPDEERRPGDEA